MLETLFCEAGVFSGRSLNLCADLRTAIINNWDDKVPVSMMEPGPPLPTTNMVQTFSTGDRGEQGENDEMKNEVTQDQIFAMVQQFRKGEGRGRPKERGKYAGTVVRVTNKTATGQVVVRGRIRKGRQRGGQRMGCRQEQLEHLKK